MTHSRSLINSLLVGFACLMTTATASAQVMSVSPQALSFVYQIGGPIPAAQNLYLSADIPAQFSVTTSGAPWANIAPSSGITPTTLLVTVKPPSDATPGTLSGTIIIGPVASVDAARLVVPVTLQILGPPQGQLVVNPNSIVTDYRIGSPPPTLMPVYVTSTGSPAAFRLATDTVSGGPWLSVSANSLVTPATVYVTITPGPNFAPGVYTGTISVIPAYAGGITQKIPVTLRASAGGTLVPNPTSLWFEYQTGTGNPAGQYIRVSDSLGANVPFSVTASTTSGGMWLSYSPVTAVTSATILVNVTPAGLPAGTYYGTVVLTPANGAASTQIPVTLTVTSTAQLLVSPPSLTFDSQLGAPPAEPQYLYVTSTGNGIRFTPSVTGPTWITVANASFVTPAGVAVNVNPPAGTAAGTYNAVVTMTDANNVASPVSAQVTVRVLAANYLSLSRSVVSFVYTVGGTIPTQMVSVTSSNGSVRFQAAASSTWLTAFQDSAYTPATLAISVVPKNLNPGTYHDTINVTSDEVSNSPQKIDVTLTISSDPTLTAAPFGLMFSYQIGAAAPPVQMAVISTRGDAQEFTLSSQTSSGGKWLIVAGGGSTPAAVAAAIDTSFLTAPGTFTGNLIITPKSSSMPPLQVPVVVNVSAGPNLVIDGHMVAFQYQTGGPAPATQTLAVGTTTGNMGVQPSVRTADGSGWLKVTPDFVSAPGNLTIAADPSGLPPGYYLGLIALYGVSQEDLIYYVPVTLQVSDGPILTVPSQYLIFRSDMGGPMTPAQMVTVRSTGAPANIQATPSSAGWMRLNPATAVGGVDLAVQATPEGMGAGYYMGVVVIEIPGVPNSQQYVPVGYAVKDRLVP